MIGTYAKVVPADWQQEVLAMRQSTNLQAPNLKKYPSSNFEWTKSITSKRTSSPPAGEDGGEGGNGYNESPSPYPLPLRGFVIIGETVRNVMLNLFQHLMESISYETLKRVQGDKK